MAASACAPQEPPVLTNKLGSLRFIRLAAASLIDLWMQANLKLLRRQAPGSWLSRCERVPSKKRI